VSTSFNTEELAAAPAPRNRTVQGLVFRSTGRWVHVKAGKEIVRARVRGRFRLRSQGHTNPVAVGDKVSLQIGTDGTGLITEIHPRTNIVSRRAAGRRVGKEQILISNVDVVWIVQSVTLPCPNAGLIDRVLVAVEAQGIQGGIALNKMDLGAGAMLDEARILCSRYEQLGYPVMQVSALTGAGIRAFGTMLKDKIGILTGPSGVGKSMMINALDPSLTLRTARVSTKTHKGRHTTAHTELYWLKGGGAIADTPGIREFGVLDVEPWELSHHFREFRRFVHDCRYAACTHDHEPQCKVKAAREAGLISKERYCSYINILDSIHAGDADVGR